MRIILSFTIFSFTFLGCKAQTNDFDSLIKSYESRVRLIYQDSIRIPLIYKGEDFNIILADTSIGFDTKTVVLQNPYSNETFPLSYSVIYEQHIISLFEPGSFVCYRLSNLSRNKQFEEKLNKKKFKAHFLIDKKLFGLAKDGFWYFYSSNNWVRTKGKPLAIASKSHLYDDDNFIIYNDCNGEWGGTIYFYNRQTEQTYFTEATCANTVSKEKDGFKILSHLGHGFGSADLKLISDPTKLINLEDYKTKQGNLSAIGKMDAIGYADSTNHAIKIFDFYGVQLFSSFLWNDKTLYIVHWQERTFIAEIHDNNILIVDPLFNSDLYTHNPITKRYESGETLINLDFYGTGGEREVSMILVKDKEITKIDWNEKQ